MEDSDKRLPATAMAQNNGTWGEINYYDIPVGNRIINLSVYATSTRSESEQRMIETTLQGITIKDGLDDIVEPSVESCR